jgi:hypothetical protein
MWKEIVVTCLRYYANISLEVQRKTTETSGTVGVPVPTPIPVPHIHRRVSTHRENFRADLLVLE